MALTTQPATVGGLSKNLIVGADGTGNIAAAHILVTSNGTEIGVANSPMVVAAASLPLPAGAATATNQPGLNSDGGALAHVTNFPAVQTVNLAQLSASFTQSPAAAASLQLKAGPGSLVSCYVTTGSTPGYLMLFDATAVPANGTVTPKHSIYCPASTTASIGFDAPVFEPYATGIAAAFSSTGPFTLTASATAFLKGVAL